MKKATTTSAAATDKGTAKVKIIRQIEGVGSQKNSVSVMVFALTTTTDPDPMDWNELDSLMSKPPTKERKPRKPAYTKPEAVRKLEQVTGHKHRDDTANGCTRCIIDYLHHKGWQAERINTTGIPIDSRRQVKDILGRTRTIGSVKIEVKMGRDRMSEAQRRYQRDIEAAGSIYYVARDFTEFVAWYHQNFGKGGTR